MIECRTAILLLLATGSVLWGASLALGAKPKAARPSVPRPYLSGQQLYRDACASCHGVDGRGAARYATGFDVATPDFTDCSFATREPDADWSTIVQEGGPVRDFDRLMPAFGDELSEEEIQRTLDYVRGFCGDMSCWPRGELNFPRPLVTSKAYPEDEAAVSTSVALEGQNAVFNQLIYETRIGARGAAEVVLPVGFNQLEQQGWTGGLGDVVLATKWALFFSHHTGSIASAALEAVLPTGREDRGLGKGVAILEPFFAIGQALPADSFIQGQVGAELSTDPDKASHELFWRAVVGTSFSFTRLGRPFSPMIELLGAREFEDEAEIQWDLVPQLQATLSKRQHVLAAAGVRIPVSQVSERNAYFMMYLLWDWYDGSLFEGW
ncbi:MAG: c-type cytochrome [Deltaproteobacteria bacterium]|nr:c-type cytochrome [Deltaproteobacteria bacterium]